MERAVISLSFDDGRGDNFETIKKILIPMEIPVTVNVTTGYVDRTCPEELKPSAKTAMTIDEIISLAKEPLVEIALHGDYHLNTEKDIASGRRKLIKWLGLSKDYVFGFASPGSEISLNEFVNSDSELFSKDISYLRTSLKIDSFPLLRIFCRKAGRIIHLPVFYKIAYSDTLMSTCYDRIIYSVPILKNISFLEVKALVDECIKRKTALTLMFHSVMQDVSKEDNWSWEIHKFQMLCEYLKKQSVEGTLDVCTTQMLYERLRG